MKTRHLVTLAALSLICYSMSGCTITTPDGSATVDSGTVLVIAKILAEK